VSERYDRLQELQREASALLGLPTDADRVVLLSALKFQHQTMLEGFIAGRNIDASELLSVTEAIGKFIPAAPPPKVELMIVEQLHGVCQKCGHVQPQTESLLPSPSPPGEANPSVSPEKPAASPNVVLLKQPPRPNP
jgi:hypothetical protein